jgi:2-isopropylmalate synthase
MEKKVIWYDTSFRDGKQAFGINVNMDDMIKMVKIMDDFGIDYIECGWPNKDNLGDVNFFQQAKNLKLSHSKLVAFSATRKKETTAEKDENMLSLLNAGTPAVAIFGKSSIFQVEKILETSLEENLRMISDSIRFMKNEGKEIIYDAEHFFDGFKSSRNYALSTLHCAFEAGADFIVLCDTNGGTTNDEIEKIVKLVNNFFYNKKAKIGIHAHNDMGLAVANSLAAVKNGTTMIQGTINGIGERCGNADLCTLIPLLCLKLGFASNIIQIDRLTGLSRFFNEILNLPPGGNQPFVGKYAFAHKGGIHVDAVRKDPSSYEHFNPEIIGNKRKIINSGYGGKSNVIIKAQELGIDPNSLDIRTISKIIKEKEAEGFQFDAADASFRIMLMKLNGTYKAPFVIKYSSINNNKLDENGAKYSTAVIEIEANGNKIFEGDKGNGPVNALDKALRKCLKQVYPEIEDIKLSDYKVRQINGGSGTASKVRVFIESKRGSDHWGTVGVSADIIDASLQALEDSFAHFLLKL